MFRSNLCLLLSAILLHAGVTYGQLDEHSPARTQYNFNTDWRLFVGDAEGLEQPGFDDADWESVSLPRAWNEDEAFAVDIHDHSEGIAWYRKRFVLPRDATSGKVFLEFEGVRQGTRVFVNGHEVGLHENGAMAFGLDITDVTRPAPAENVVAVRTDNAWDYRDKTGQRLQWVDKNFNANYGGIPKNVKLHVTGKLYQTLPLYSNLGTLGVYVYAGNFNIPGGNATIHAESQVRNESDKAVDVAYQVVVTDMDGKEVGRFSHQPVAELAAGETATLAASGRLEKLHFWSWGYGYLYNVDTSLMVDGKPVDTVRTRTGFRKTETRDGMLLLNDRVLQIKGYAQRTSNEWPAIGLPSAPWLSDFSNRMMVQSNANTVRWMHITPSKQDVESCDRVGLMMLMPAGDAEKDVTGRRWEQRVELMRDAIIYNRNNPSVVFLEGGNESISEQHMAEIKGLRDQYDPHGGRLAGCREMLDSNVAEWGGEMLYINKSADIPLFATEYCRDEGLRKYWDDWSPPYHTDGDGPDHQGQSAASYNRNQDSFAIEDVVRWYDYWQARPGTGRRVSSGGLNIIFSDSNSHMRGAENYRRSGEVDPMRIPKDAFFAHRTVWNGWVDIEEHGLHIIGHWNYTRETVKPVYVVSTADQVELFASGKSLGKGTQSSRFLFTFPDVPWRPGTLRAFGYNEEGKQLCEGELVTAGPPAALRLSHWNNPSGIRADGSDLVLVQVEVIDADSRRCPTAFNSVDFDLEGAAEWRGGIAQGRDDNYILATSLPVECGINRVLLRSTTQPGKIRLTAKVEGLPVASLELESKPVDVAGGLSTDDPSSGLPSFLEFGPTPAGPSYTVTRLPIKIASANAGSRPDAARLSLDDNELTKWSSDGGKEGAWITYHFDNAQLVDEVCLKLNDWRSTSYPIRMFVDGKSVWSGNTPRSLGYVTLSFDPVAGKSLTVALDGVTSIKDEFGEIVEVTGVVDQAAAKKGNRLAIVEAEIYGPLKSQSSTDRSVAAGRKPSGFAAPDGLRRSAKPVGNRLAEPKTVFRNLQLGKKQTVVVYGTSLTIQGAWSQALKDYFDKNFPGQVNFFNSAKSGMNSDWGVANLKPRVLAKNPDLVFIEFSANDAATKHDISLEKSTANLDRMVKALRAQNPQVDVVLQTMNPAWDSPKVPKSYGSDRPNLAAYYDVYRNYAHQHDLPLVDHYPNWVKLQQDSPEEFKKSVSDGIHPHSGPSLAVTWPAIESLLERTRTAATPLVTVDVWPEAKMPGRGAREPETIRTPERSDAIRVTNVSRPTLTVFPAAKQGEALAPAMIVCPGGGYSYVVMDKEGTEIAAWLNANGISALVLKYRNPNNRGGALQDLQRALSLARAYASE